MPLLADEPPIVILNMHYTGLAIARDLGRSDRQIIGLSADKQFFGNRSKHVTYRACPDTETAAEECRDFLLDLSKQLACKPVLLPTRDHDIHFIVKYREQLDDAFVITYPDSSVLDSIMDKTVLSKAAEDASVYCPRSVEVRQSTDIESCRNTFVFPSVVKPAIAAHWRRAGIRDIVENQKAIRVTSFEELQQLYARIEPYNPGVIVQEYIEGPESDLVVFGSYCDERSRVLAHFTGRKLLQYPARAGTGIVVEACLLPDIVEPSARLLACLKYSGMSEIEYKFDQRRNRYALIEINPRHWDQHGLGSAVGVNLSEAMYAHICGREAAAGTQSGQKVRWIAEDGFLISLIGNIRRHDYPWSAYFDVLTGRKLFAVFSLKDPKPGFRLMRTVAANILSGVAGALRRLISGKRRSAHQA